MVLSDVLVEGIAPNERADPRIHASMSGHLYTRVAHLQTLL